MSDERYSEKLIKEFLDEVEEKLPFWLKVEEEEAKDVLNELREHVEDKADGFLALGEADSSLKAVQMAIMQMGSPSEIAHEYKRRGIPKFFITEELFPMYLTVLRYAALAVGLLVVIITPISILVAALTGGNWGAALGQGILWLVFGLLIAAAAITAIFTWLSYEGYFPEDIKHALKTKEQKKEAAAQPPKVKVEPPLVTEPGAKKEEKKLPKGIKKPSELIPGGIFTVIIAILAIVQPITYINNKILAHPSGGGVQFLELLFFIGIVWLILGILEVIHGMFSSWSYEGNKTLLPVRAIFSWLALPIVIILLLNPQIFPIFWFDGSGLIVLEITANFYWLYYLIGALIIIGIIAGAIYKIFIAAMLKEEDFFDRGIA